MLLEIFVIPGLNIFGIVGLLTAVAGIGYAYVNMGGLAAGVVAGVGLFGHRHLGENDAQGPRLEPLGAQRWYDAQGRLRFGQARAARRCSGRRGQAVTTLRPAGRAQFGERVVDVVSEGGYIERGEQVEVLKVAGNRVVVQPVQSRVLVHSFQGANNGSPIFGLGAFLASSSFCRSSPISFRWGCGFRPISPGSG